MYEVLSSEWNHNGSHTVEVRTDSAFTTAKTIRKARDLARKSVSRPDLVQWTRENFRYLDDDLKTVHVFTVSRLERFYR